MLNRYVLIESDWNLKCLPCQDLYHLRIRINRIRLEFKDSSCESCSNVFHVLIESDWNLKCPGNLRERRPVLRINRIRLEFKAKHGLFSKVLLPGINRIRLEFKVWSFEGFNIAIYVLIESDWNLKYRSTLLCYLLT